MNIAFIHAGFSNSGGIERVVSIILNSLSKDESLNIFSIEYIKGSKQCVEINSCVHRFYLYEKPISMTNAIAKGKIIGKVKKIIKENKIDIVIGCGVLYFPVTVVASKSAGAKSVCWEHTNPKVTDDYKFQKQMRAFGLKFSDANILITKSAKTFYDSVKAKKNVLIYNPVDDKLFENQCVYNAQSKKIISVGRLCYAKNYDLLIKIAEKVLSRFEDWSWDIYGDGEEREHLEKLISDTCVKDRLILKGNALNIYELYPEYSFLVMTSRYEGFPMVLLEAAAKSLPLVSFDIETGPNEIINDNVNGYLIKNNSREEMEAKIGDLIIDAEKRQMMSDNVFKTAQTFSVDKICKDWKLFFEEVNG